MMNPIALTNSRQEGFYQTLKKHRFPAELATLFANLYMALDLFQAHLRLLAEELTAGVPADFRAKLAARFQEQTLRLPAKRVNEISAIAKPRIDSEEILYQSLLVPFAVRKEDNEAALGMWDLILKAGLQEDLKINTPASLSLIPMLMLNPNAYTWPLLAEQVQKGNQRARLLLTKLVNLLGFWGIRPKFLGYSHPCFSWMEEENFPLSRMVDEFSRNIPWGSHDAHKLPVPDDTVFACNRAKQEAVGQQVGLEEYIQIVSWFGGYEEKFQELAFQMWEEVSTNASHGLRPGGRDVIAIKIPALHKRGLRHLQLIPMTQFPQTLVRHWVVMESLDFRYFIQRPLTDAALREDPEEVEEGLESVADRLRQFIAIHSLWKITTGQIFKKIRHEKTAKGEQKREELARTFVVRPHFRWLVPGWKPSDRALQRSLDMFSYLPPTGKTFVKSDLTPEEVVAGIQPLDPAHPVYTYTLEDLGYNE